MPSVCRSILGFIKRVDSGDKFRYNDNETKGAFRLDMKNSKILTTLEFHKILNKLAGYASTSLGKTRSEELLPSSDFEEVKIRLKETDEAAAVVRLKGSLPFGGIRDIRFAVQRANIGGLLNPQELYDVAQTTGGGRKLKRFLLAFHEEHPIPLLAEICSSISELKPLDKEIMSCLDDHAEIADYASPELARIRQSIRSSESRIREKLEQMIRQSSTQKKLQETIITIRNDRYVIPVKQEYRSSFGGMIHDQSASGATLFIEPEAVVQLNNQLRELRFKEEAEIEKILQRLTALVAENELELSTNVEMLAQLDFITAKAYFAEKLKATLPRLNDRGFFKLRKARHPLIPAEEVVPIDVELGNDYSLIMVTGPNTGGKTVSLKTIGLLHLMAMSGMFVPVEDGSQMCVFDAIYADIGDEQSIEQSLSTFSSHLTNIIRIIKQMTPKSLVLLDELGAGTDPAEGSALAIAIIEHIHSQGCRMVVTTHFSELKAYAYEKKGVINASMEFDVQSLSPTYRLLLGVPGRSNAFAIAKRLGLSEQIIQQASSQVGEDDQRVESMIASLEENRKSAESDRQKAASLRKQVEQLQQKHQEQQDKFDRQREKLVEKAQAEAQLIIDKAKAEAETIISELRSMAMNERASIKEHKLIDAKSRLNQASDKLQPISQQQKLSKRRNAGKVNVGDEVFVAAFGQKGHIVEEASDKEWLVQLGIMKMKVAKDAVELLKSPAKPSPSDTVKATLKRTKEAEAKNELDLRGTNLQDALMEVDQFLDEAILANLGQVSIIHGKGTGVLRSGVQELLRKHRHVKKFRYGAYNEGGNGVTIAELN